jgi:ribonuclease BN (tRNA processing enzyme)
MDTGANHPAQSVPTFVPRLAGTAKSQPFEAPNSVLSHTRMCSEVVVFFVAWPFRAVSRAVRETLPGEDNGTVTGPGRSAVTVTFAGSGDAFGSGGRYQACIHVRGPGSGPVLVDCGATSLSALKGLGLDPGEITAVFVSHLHGDHFGGLPFLILDGQFSRRTGPLAIAGPRGTARRLGEAMECLFPGSASAPRRFGVEVTELSPGSARTVCGVTVRCWEGDHPSGAPALLLRLDVAGRTIAYTGDTAWTGAVADAAAGADLLIAEAYYRDKNVPYHLRLADLDAHRDRLTARRIILTHMSADMLGRQHEAPYESARDGLVIRL